MTHVSGLHFGQTVVCTNAQSLGVLKNLFCICKQDVAESRIPIMLCGNKSDLRSKYKSKGQKPVSLKEGEAMAKEHEVSENFNYA